MITAQIVMTNIKKIKDNLNILSQIFIIISLAISVMFFFNRLSISFDRLEAKVVENQKKIDQNCSKFQQIPSNDIINTQYKYISDTLEELKDEMIRCRELNQKMQEQIYMHMIKENKK